MREILIATWDMALEGMQKAQALLSSGAGVREAVETAVTTVEDNPAFTSVGYGGLPDSAGQVELDAAYMDGETLDFGGVMGVQRIANPIRAAIRLCGLRRNYLLCAAGAEAYAEECGLPLRDMLTEEARARWEKERNRQGQPGWQEQPGSYQGHDTVCVLALDCAGKMAGGVSTSGLFMKHPGRVGDSPIIGSGLYCDAEAGAAAATGLGEEIMRGCIAYETVRCMREGMNAEEACRHALMAQYRRLARAGRTPTEISVIALGRDGQVGAATTLEKFPYVYAAADCPAEVRTVERLPEPER